MTEMQMQTTEARLQEDLNRVANIKAILELNKPLYEEMDLLVVRIAQTLQATGLGDVQQVGSRFFTLVDNFENKNTVFRPCGVKRFEILVESKEEHAVSVAKAIAKAAKANK